VESGVGVFWLIGWLFTIGYAHLDFWRGLFGLIVWPTASGSRCGRETGSSGTSREHDGIRIGRG